MLICSACGLQVVLHSGCKELWDDIISFPFIKRGPIYPIPNEIRNEVLKHLFLTFKEFNQLLSLLPLRYLQVISLSQEPPWAKKQDY